MSFVGVFSTIDINDNNDSNAVYLGDTHFGCLLKSLIDIILFTT